MKKFTMRRSKLLLGFSAFSLLTSGCGVLPRSHQEPDHVFAPPQMMQQDEGSSEPVRAVYPPDTVDAASVCPTEADGIVTMASSLSVAQQSTSSASAPGDVILTSFAQDEECPLPTPGFLPAEPRFDRDPNCPPSNHMETIAASPLADLYPDEYVFDGGDRGYKAAMHNIQKSGIETEDTVAGFTDHTGSAKTTASNRVAVYAPRFGSVRTVTGLVADTKVDKAAGAKDSLAIGNLKTGRAAQENIHGTQISGIARRERVDGMQSSTPPLQSKGTDVAGQNRKVDEGHEGRAYSSPGMMHRNDRFQQSELVQNAIIWTRNDFPVISASTINASEITAKFKVQQTVGLKDERETPGNIQIVKLADRDVAQAGEIVTFTIRFANTGDFDVYDVQIVDNLTPRLEYVSGTAKIDASHPGEVSVEPNGEGSSILTFTLDKPLKGHDSGTITFEARVK
ncbi:MAG: hypothetical protein ACK58L_06580 [Planctomycetota bacterium]